MPKFNEHQVVRLKSGGLEMTVQGYARNPRHLLDITAGKHNTKEPYYSDFVICTWFDGVSLKRENFHEDSLELVR